MVRPHPFRWGESEEPADFDPGFVGRIAVTVKQAPAVFPHNMGERSIQAGTAVTGFLGVALVVFGAYRLRAGAGTVEELIALAFLAVTVIAGYRSLAVHGGPRINAVGNTALFVAGAAAYSGGVNFSFDPAVTAGQALFAIAVGYFFVRLV